MSNPPILMLVDVKKWSLFLDSSVKSTIFCTQKQSLIVIGPIRAAYCYIHDFFMAMFLCRPFLGSLFPESEYLRALHRRTSRAGIDKVGIVLYSQTSPILSGESFQKVKILLPINQIAKEAEGGISFLATR